MGFKDQDIHTATHDEVVLKVADEEFLRKFLKQHYNYDDISDPEITIEKILSDKYRKYGFLDVFITFHAVMPKEHYNVFANVPDFFLGRKYLSEHHELNNATYGVFDKCDYPTRSIIIFFEIKTGSPSLGAVIREMEYYKDVLKKTGHVSTFDNDIFHAILISNQVFPKNFKQFDHFTISEIQPFFS